MNINIAINVIKVNHRTITVYNNGDVFITDSKDSPSNDGVNRPSYYHPLDSIFIDNTF